MHNLFVTTLQVCYVDFTWIYLIKFRGQNNIPTTQQIVISIGGGRTELAWWCSTSLNQ